MSNPCRHVWERLAVVGGWAAAGEVQLRCDCGAYLDFDIADARFVTNPTLTSQMPNPSPIEEIQKSWDEEHLSKEHFNKKARRYYKAHPLPAMKR